MNHSFNAGCNSITNPSFRPYTAKYRNLKMKTYASHHQTLIPYNSDDQFKPLINNLMYFYTLTNRLRRKKRRIIQRGRVYSKLKFKDKEELLEDIVKCKQYRDMHHEENAKLKALVKQYQKEAEEKDEVIQLILKQIDSKDTKNQTHLVFNLRRQLKDLKEEVKSKEAQVAAMKSNPKTTKLNELEIEMQIIEEERVRLRGVIKGLARKRMGGYSAEEIKKMQETAYQQNLMINTMKEESTKLFNTLKAKDKNYNKLKEEVVKLEESLLNLKKKNDEIVKQNKEFKDSNMELKALKGELTLIKISTKDKQVVESQAKVKTLLMEQEDTKVRIEKKKRVIQELRAKFKEEKKKDKKLQAEFTTLKEQRMIMPIVKKEELSRMAWTIRFKLIGDEIPPADLRNVILNSYKYRSISFITMIMILYQYMNFQGYFLAERNVNHMIRLSYHVT